MRSGAGRRPAGAPTARGVRPGDRDPRGEPEHYRANPGSPVFEELRALVLKTVGLADVLRAALAPRSSGHSRGVRVRVGRQGPRYCRERHRSLGGQRPVTHADLFTALEPATAQLGRRVTPTIYSPKELAKRVKQENAFVTRVLSAQAVAHRRRACPRRLRTWPDPVNPSAKRPRTRRSLPGSSSPASGNWPMPRRPRMRSRAGSTSPTTRRTRSAWRHCVGRVSLDEPLHCLPGAAAHPRGRSRGVAGAGQMP